MSRWIVFVAGVLVGIVGLVLLFIHPADTIFWLMLLSASSLLMRAHVPPRVSPPPADPEKDVSTFALVLAICAILAFAIFWVVSPPMLRFVDRLIPYGLLPLSRMKDRGPAPVLARMAMAAWWTTIMYRFYVKHRQA